MNKSALLKKKNENQGKQQGIDEFSFKDLSFVMQQGEKGVQIGAIRTSVMDNVYLLDGPFHYYGPSTFKQGGEGSYHVLYKNPQIPQQFDTIKKIDSHLLQFLGRSAQTDMYEAFVRASKIKNRDCIYLNHRKDVKYMFGTRQDHKDVTFEFIQGLSKDFNYSCEAYVKYLGCSLYEKDGNRKCKNRWLLLALLVTSEGEKANKSQMEYTFY